jgi:uncharacterized protein (DUF736 family)
MAIIGSFTKTENGFTGAIKTLSLDVNAKLVPTPKDNEKGPDFRVLVGHIEFGAGGERPIPSMSAWTIRASVHRFTQIS